MKEGRSGNARQSFLNKNDNDDGDGEHYVNKFYSDDVAGVPTRGRQ